MKYYFRLYAYIAVTAIFFGAIAIALGAFLLFSSPHIPSLNEIRFRWRLTGQLDSPSQIRQLTGFAWEKVCIKDDFDWLERPDKGNYILIFYQESKPVEEFSLDKNKHPNLELHLNHCFEPDQKIFHKIEDYNNG